MKKKLTTILILIGSITFGQEFKPDSFDSIANSIESDTSLVLSRFNEINIPNYTSNQDAYLRVWRKNNVIAKIEFEIKYDATSELSTIYFDKSNPIKITEIIGEWTILPDSIAREKGYSVDLIENFKATSYILNWNKKVRKLIIDKNQNKQNSKSYSFAKYNAIIRKAKKLIAE